MSANVSELFALHQPLTHKIHARHSYYSLVRCIETSKMFQKEIRTDPKENIYSQTKIILLQRLTSKDFPKAPAVAAAPEEAAETEETASGRALRGGASNKKEYKAKQSNIKQYKLGFTSRLAKTEQMWLLLATFPSEDFFHRF